MYEVLVKDVKWSSNAKVKLLQVISIYKIPNAKKIESMQRGPAEETKKRQRKFNALKSYIGRAHLGG
jgi:hypothetical protein